MTLPSISPTTAKDRLAIALDVPTLDQAETLAAAVAPHMGVAKIGLQLYSAYGPEAVKRIQAAGLAIFLDLKLHDIPNTVGSAATELGRMGVQYTTVHASGGTDMVRAAVEGLAAGADKEGLPAPTVLAVTVLTSDATATPEALRERLGWALAAGATGCVCAAPDLAVVKAHAPTVFATVPGIRFAEGDTHDQARVATPGSAITDGADMLVIGRAVSGAADPASAAARAHAEADAAIEGN